MCPGKRNHCISIYYQNAAGLRTKLDEFRNNLTASSSDLYAVTETGCADSIFDAELIPPSFQIIRCDRSDGRKQGGALLVATPDFELKRLSPSDVIVDREVFEIVCAAVYRKKRLITVLCVVYIPPKSADNDYMCLFRIIENLCLKYVNLLVVGDFNMYSCSAEVKNYFEYFVAFCGFTQRNSVPNNLGRCLDLVLTTEEASAVEVSLSSEPLTKIDQQHPPLAIVATVARRGTATLPMPSSPVNVQSTSAYTSTPWNFYKADFPLLYSILYNMDWDDLYVVKNVD